MKRFETPTYMTPRSLKAICVGWSGGVQLEHPKGALPGPSLLGPNTATR
jgi:hypothetical protein